MAFVSAEVKVWKNIGLNIQKEGTAPFSKKEGPYHGLSKSESSALSATIMAELNQEVDWKKPDEILHVKPKYQPAKQIVKMSGN